VHRKGREILTIERAIANATPPTEGCTDELEWGMWPAVTVSNLADRARAPLLHQDDNHPDKETDSDQE